jgi:hypothetical protein
VADLLEDVHFGTIGRRAGVPADAEQWGWRCGFLSRSRRGARAEGTAADFDQARSQFEAAWRKLRPSYTDADFAEYRRARAWTAWKQTMLEPGEQAQGRGERKIGERIIAVGLDASS